MESHFPDKIVIGPTTMIPFKVNNIYRFGIIIKYKQETDLKKYLRELIDHYIVNNKLRIEVSFNPYNI